MVDQPEFLVIKTHVAEDGASFTIDVQPGDIGKIIGSQGRNAKSLRTVMSAIGRKLHRRYAIDIDDESPRVGAVDTVGGACNTMPEPQNGSKRPCI